MLHRERRVVRLGSYRARWYWGGTAGWIAWFVTPLLPGWLIGRVFDQLQAHGTTARFWWLLGFLAAAEVGAALVLYVAHRAYVQGLESAKGLLRANVLRGQLASGGTEAAARDVPVGDVLARLRDDPHDVMFLLDNWVDLFGSILYGTGAAWLLARIDPWAAVVGVVPLLLVGFANSQVGHFARRFRLRSRAAGSAVGDFLNAAFEASLTVKVAGAQPDVLRRLDELNATRAHATVRDSVWNDIVWTLNSALADVFVGLALVVAARHRLTAGEITQFASYLFTLVWLPMRIGGVLVGRRRFDVSEARLDALVAPTARAGEDHLVAHRSLPILGGPPAPAPRLAPRRPLERLEVRGLTIVERGLVDVDLRLDRGTLTVVSGPVGSGKSSLLRGVLGLLALDGGEVCWNGVPVADPASFFVPPQCAYVPQVPRLFAESLADNLRLGHGVDADDLAEAVRLAAFDADVADLPDRLATLVGARGVRLSGGQAQRAAGARALAHRPELLVLDDLTSALDVETEEQLWERLAAAGYTVLAASNRPAALARAHRVVALGS